MIKLMLGKNVNTEGISISNSQRFYCSKKSVEQNQCHYFERIRKLADHQSLTKGEENEIWDIEDLIHSGQEIGGKLSALMHTYLRLT